MKKIAVGSLLLCVALPMQAAPFSVQPQPGEWQVSTQTFVEGNNVGPQLLLIKQQAAAFLKPAQLEKLNKYDPSQFNECLTPTQASVLADPQKSMDFLVKALGQCQLQLDSQTHNAMTFSGYCDASKHGIEGKVNGQLNYQSQTQVTGFIEGVGTLPPPVQLLLLGRVQPQVHLRNNFTADLQQTSCSAR